MNTVEENKKNIHEILGAIQVLGTLLGKGTMPEFDKSIEEKILELTTRL